MAMICYKPHGSCKSCIFLKYDTERQDNVCIALKHCQKITDYICSVFRETKDSTIYLPLTELTTLGYSLQEVKEFAEVHKIKLCCKCNPDNPNELLECMSIGLMNVAELLNDK